MTETQTGKQSRNGKKPVVIAQGVQVTISGQDVTAKGPKGELTHTLVPRSSLPKKRASSPFRQPPAPGKPGFSTRVSPGRS